MQRPWCCSSCSSTRHRWVAVHTTAAASSSGVSSSGVSSSTQPTPSRRRRLTTNQQQLELDAAAAEEANASSASSSRAAAQSAAAAAPPSPSQRGRRRKGELAAGSAATLVQSLVDATRLSRASAEALVASLPRYSGIPRDLGRLASRVAHLQQLLSPQHADLAVRRYPNLMAHSPETLALNYQQWQAFFAPDSDGGDSSSSSDGQAAAAAQQAMLRRLARSPQLLGVAVERQVGNLYEAGVMLDAQDLHEFAYQAMSLGRVQPQTLHEKLRRTLAFLNTVLQQEQAEQVQADTRQQAQQQQLPAVRPLQQQHKQPQPVTSSSGGGRQKQQRSRLEAVSLVDLQKAARRDHNWLTLNSDTLQQRLTELRDQLQLSWQQTVRVFLQQPSVLNKRPALMGQRAAALQALPGMGRERGQAVVLAMPTILQVSPAIVASRWQQLGEAAASHPGWAERFAALSPTTIASLLIRSQARYDRLAEVARLGHQDANSFVTVLAVSADAYGQMLAQHQQTQQPAAGPQAQP